MSQVAAFRTSPGHRPLTVCLARGCVLLLLSCLLAGELVGQEAAPVTDVPQGGFWSDTQRQTYVDAKTTLDKGEALTSRLRRELWEVCDDLALNLRGPQYVDDRIVIRDLLVAVGTNAVRSVTTHLLAADAPDDVRLHGIIALKAIADPVAPKEGILQALDDPSASVRLWAVRAAADKEYTDAGPKLCARILDESSEVSLAAVDAVATLKVAGAESYLVSLGEREAVGRQPLVEKLARLQGEEAALKARTNLSAEEQMRQINLGQDIEEVSGQVAFLNLLIFKVGEALDVLTNGADGQKLKGYLSAEDLQQVIDGLKRKYGSASP